MSAAPVIDSGAAVPAARAFANSVRRRLAYRPWHLLVNVIAASQLILPRTRQRIYRAAGLSVNTTAVRHGCMFHTSKISIGEDTLVGQRCHFENREQITIGARCSIAAEVMIVTSSHQLGSTERRAGEYAGAEVVVGDACWLGARAMILPGVVVGDGCVIAAGAVVNRDCQASGVYAGVPARRVRDL